MVTGSRTRRHVFVRYAVLQLTDAGCCAKARTWKPLAIEGMAK